MCASTDYLYLKLSFVGVSPLAQHGLHYGKQYISSSSSSDDEVDEEQSLLSSNNLYFFASFFFFFKVSKSRSQCASANGLNN